MSEENKKCEWTSDCSDWETSCGKSFCFEDGGPDHNDMKFCPFCGKELEEIDCCEDD